MNGDNFSYLLMFYQCGTVFQTAFLTACYNPETASRVTLASLGTVFQTALLSLLVIPRLRPGLLSLRSVLASSQSLFVVFE